MAFYDDLARDPKSEKEFWTIIEETFVQVEAALTDYPAETRDEALAGTLRGGNFKDASISGDVPAISRARATCAPARACQRVIFPGPARRAFLGVMVDSLRSVP